MYKLTPIGVLDEAWQPVAADDPDYLAWLGLGNTLEKMGFPTVEEEAQSTERLEAPNIARQWFAGQQAAKDFVRLTPAQQASQIDAMTLAQLRTVVKYLAIAVSMLIKRELL